MNRIKRAAVTAAALALTVCPAGVAAARATGRHTVTFTSTFNDEGTRASFSPDCDGHPRGDNVIVYEGTATFAGDLTAVDDYCGLLTYDVTGGSVVGEGWDTMTGSLRGCGTGTFVIHQTDYHTSAAVFDPATGHGHLTLRWEIEPGSGTNDFAGASGSGTAYADFDPPTDPSHPVALPNHGAYTGTITCRRAPS